MNYFGNSEEEAFSLKEANFKFAFTLVDFISKETLNDTRYVKWTPSIYSKPEDSEKATFVPISFHECTESDYAGFNPIAEEQKGDIDAIKSRGLFCLDDFEEDLALGGSGSSPFFRQIAFLWYPCNVQSGVIFDVLDNTVSEDCIADWDKQIKYLGQP